MFSMLSLPDLIPTVAAASMLSHLWSTTVYPLVTDQLHVPGLSSSLFVNFVCDIPFAVPVVLVGGVFDWYSMD